MSKSKKPQPKGTPDRITRTDISYTHFGGKAFPTDMYYVGVANKIYPIIRKYLKENSHFPAATSKQMAIVLTCYVEDLVAETGVWQAFMSLYRKTYGNSRPFIDPHEETSSLPYDDREPSFHAVLFLIWYVANNYTPGTLLNPNNPGFQMLAMQLMPDLLEAFDLAPDTPSRPQLTRDLPEDTPLFFLVRELCEWLSNRCYLTRIIDREQVNEDIDELLDMTMAKMGEMDPSARDYARNMFVVINAKIGPLAIPSYRWLAEIVRISHLPDEAEFLPILDAIEVRPYQMYRYEKISKSEATLKDLNGERLTLSPETMPFGEFMPQIVAGDSAMESLVYFNGVWLLNGFGVQSLPHKAFDNWRRAFDERKQQQRHTFEHLLKAFGKRRIGVCRSYDEFAHLAFGDKELPMRDSDPGLIDHIREAGNLVYFLNEDGNITLLPGVATIIKIKDNPFYDPEQAVRGISLILDHSYTTPEMRAYLIDHRLLPDAAINSALSPDSGRRLFQQDIRFLNDYTSRDTLPPVAAR